MEKHACSKTGQHFVGVLHRAGQTAALQQEISKSAILTPSAALINYRAYVFPCSSHDFR